MWASPSSPPVATGWPRTSGGLTASTREWEQPCSTPPSPPQTQPSPLFWVWCHVLLCHCPRVEPTEEGDYRLCFDNSFSKLSEKMVFFEVILEGQAGAADGGDGWVEMGQPESLVEFKLEYMRVRWTNQIAVLRVSTPRVFTSPA